MGYDGKNMPKGKPSKMHAGNLDSKVTPKRHGTTGVPQKVGMYPASKKVSYSGVKKGN